MFLDFPGGPVFSNPPANAGDMVQSLVGEVLHTSQCGPQKRINVLVKLFFKLGHIFELLLGNLFQKSLKTTGVNYL